MGKNEEEHEIVLEKYHRGISHVEGLLKLDKLRQVRRRHACGAREAEIETFTMTFMPQAV